MAAIHTGQAQRSGGGHFRPNGVWFLSLVQLWTVHESWSCRGRSTTMTFEIEIGSMHGAYLVGSGIGQATGGTPRRMSMASGASGEVGPPVCYLSTIQAIEM